MRIPKGFSPQAQGWRVPANPGGTVQQEIQPQRVCRKKVFLCASVKILCASVVKLLQKTITTEARRSHRDTEIDFPDRPQRGYVNNTVAQTFTPTQPFQ